ncbi:MAG: hypothetical protein R2733_07315 [Acidimicrobiales bacterium]
MDLSGSWRAAPLDAELNRSGADPDLDDSGWNTVTVPGHWGETSRFAHAQGPLLYRRQFEHEPTEPGKRSWLALDGVLAQSEIWLDGRFVGDTIGYFVPHQFEITDALNERDQHVLAIEVSCPDQGDSSSKRSLTGSLQSGPLAPSGSPGGIWRPVRIERTGPIAIRYARVICQEATDAKAVLRVRLVVDALSAGEARIDTSVTGPDGEAAGGGAETHELASGENRLEWKVEIDQPSLWWPAALGSQPLYEVGVAIRTPDNEVSDRRHWRTGLRRISVNNMVWRVNGERMFVKGVSLGPQDRFLGSMDTGVIADDLRSVRDAGLDLVRVHGHVARSELYEAADRQGVLLWQDLPLVGPYATSTRKLARRIARDVVDLLGHHPSVAVWCAHDEPNGPPLPEPNRSAQIEPPTARRLGRHLFPSWNRSVLDPLLRREIRSADTSRSVIVRSGSLPLLTDLSASDPHLWLGWHSGTYEDLPELIRQWPRLGAFLGGFGSQSVTVADWDEDAPQFASAQAGAFDRYVPRRAYADGESWALATRAYQAELLRFHIETIRRLKYSPAGGFCLLSLIDADPDGGFGLLDHERHRKPAFDAVADACTPVAIVADQPPAITTAGAPIQLAVHAISDLRTTLGNVEVIATATCGSWSHRQTWHGDLPADSCQLIGELAFEVPDLNGQLVIDLSLLAVDRAATNRYHSVVIPPSEATTRHSVRR